MVILLLAKKALICLHKFVYKSLYAIHKTFALEKSNIDNYNQVNIRKMGVTRVVEVKIEA